MQNKDKNVLVLAYIGDAIYELIIRDYLIKKVNIKLMIYNIWQLTM